MERATYQRLPTCISSCKTAARTSRLFPATRKSLQTAFDIRRYAEDWVPACSPRCDQLENHVVRLAHKGCKRFLWSWWYRRLFLSVIPVLERSLRKPCGRRERLHAVGITRLDRVFHILRTRKMVGSRTMVASIGQGRSTSS